MVRNVAVALSWIAITACGASRPCPEAAATPGSGNDRGAASAASSDPASGAASSASSSPPPAPPAPAGFVQASVEGVVPTPDGAALLLADPARTRVVPVMIGPSEAMVIDLRLRGERYERPLTHDLLDAIVARLGGSIVMVQVDKLRTGVFIGSVFVWDGATMHRIDARTSDAVAIALGAHAPIYVSTGVFEEAGLAP